MRALIFVLFVLLVCSGCATFPTCKTVADTPGWKEIDPSAETYRVREVAANARMLDHDFSWGTEYWYTDHEGNYLLCANNCAESVRDIRYAVSFKRVDGSLIPRWEPNPVCRD